MTSLNRILQIPSYGYEKNGEFYKPSHQEIFREFLNGINIFKSKKNWIGFFGWFTTFILAVWLFDFFIHYWSFKLALIGFLYSMVAMGSFGTFWFHRYSTHRAFTFKNSFFIFLCRNLVIKIIPEEIYVISHHVHHQIPEQAGDPYNVKGGWLYCFLADVTHQTIAKNLSERDYALICRLMNHTGVRLNSYKQYQRWGSLCHPAWTILHYVLNWSLWYGCFFLIGGHALATAIFGFAGVWAVGIRTFNYEGHGKGRDRRREGIDFNKNDWSVNQKWPGFVAGEWHSNHHLFPTSARSGFLNYQLDIPWLLIKTLNKAGVVTGYRDFKTDFLETYYAPYQQGKLETHLGTDRLADVRLDA